MDSRSQPGNNRFIVPALALGLLVALTILVYFPGLSGSFILDDYSNITSNTSIQIEEITPEAIKKATLSGTSSKLKRPVSMLSFALNWHFSGFDAGVFKATNLVIHLLCGIAIYFLTLLILRASAVREGDRLTDSRHRLISLVITAFWLLHPVNLTGVLYIVQRMTSLSALFVLLGMIAYMKARLDQLDGRPGFGKILFAFLVCTPLAILSKENGALLPLFLLLLELAFFGFRHDNERSRRLLMTLFGVFLLLPLAAAGLYLYLHPDQVLGGYVLRDFTLPERLLTEARIVWLYISMILAPTNGALGLFHDDIVLSTGITEPLTTLFAIAGLAALALGAVLALKKHPILGFGILFFLAGHLMESTFIPLELMYEHRNYLPGYGLLLIAGYYLVNPNLLQKIYKLRIVSAGLVVVLLAFGTFTRATIWGSPVNHSIHEAYNHPNSPRANMELASTYAGLAMGSNQDKARYYALSNQLYLKSGSLKPGFTNPYFALIKVACLMGEPVQDEWVAELTYRLENEPFAPNNVNWLEIYGDYNKQMACTIPQPIMLDIIKASLANPNIPNVVKAPLLISSSKYFSNHLNDNAAALYLLAQASDETPDEPRIRLHLALLLTRMGRYEDALAELDQAVKLDRFGAISNDIGALRRRIENIS